MTSGNRDILAEICARKREHIAAQKALHSLSELRDRAAAAETPRGFLSALRQKRAEALYGFICEIKRASPSKGLIRKGPFEPGKLAAAYQAGGAACLSVLTDEPYFQGKDAYLPQAKKACSLPVLRKDFMLDPYQVTEARALGADCILLILSALSPDLAAELEAHAFDLGMDVLIEVHDAEEMDRALGMKSPLIGVNNRNLKTMAVDIATTIELSQKVGEGHLLVAESGLSDPSDLAQCDAAGVTSFLIGESFMRADDVAAAVASLQKRAPSQAAPRFASEAAGE